MTKHGRPVDDRNLQPTPHAPLSVSAPGSLMIAGEHAVLHGCHALVGAVDQRVTVTLSPRRDDIITINSALGTRKMTRTTIDTSRPLHFLGTILQQYHHRLPSGCDLHIQADFPADVGLGSSAAITVATLAAIQTWITATFPPRSSLMQEAVTLVRQVQGAGSGADVAASVWGGILLYKATPKVVRRHAVLPPVTLVYAGYKTPTPEVIRIVETQREQSEPEFAVLFRQIDANAQIASAAIQTRDWPTLGTALTHGQTLMEALGVCDATLADIVTRLHAAPGMLGAKISGSGLGDCVLGIGALSAVEWPYRVIPIALSNAGVRHE